MHALKFTAFPEVCGIDPGKQTMLIFSDKCLFNTDGLFGRKKQRDLSTACPVTEDRVQ